MASRKGSYDQLGASARNIVLLACVVLLSIVGLAVIVALGTGGGLLGGVIALCGVASMVCALWIVGSQFVGPLRRFQYSLENVGQQGPSWQENAEVASSALGGESGRDAVEAGSDAEQYAALVDALGESFDSDFRRIIRALSETTGHMHATADVLVDNAKIADSYSAEVVNTTDTAISVVQSAAAATEEMSRSLEDIRSQVEIASETSVHAVTAVEHTSRAMNQLDSAAQKIGEIVDLIKGIASQTNLLALNATIEAARAGEAGRGFAVVASEVKSLASQTANATGDITGQIEAIQTSTRETVVAISKVRKTISDFNQMSQSVFNSVGQQGEATREIARSVQAAADSTRELAESVGHIAAVTNSTGVAAREIYDALFGLSRGTVDLDRSSMRFLSKLRQTSRTGYRLITRAEFDGIVCGAIFKRLGLVDDILFAHPKEVQDKLITVGPQDILANLPFAEGAHMVFSHRARRSNTDAHRNYITDVTAPSSTRVVYQHYSGDARLSGLPTGLLEAVDNVNSGKLSRDDISDPKGWILLGFLLDARTGMGRFKLNQPYTETLYETIDMLNVKGLDAILTSPNIAQMAALYREHQPLAKQQIEQCVRLHDNVLVLNLLDQKLAYTVNRFMMYMMYPQCNLSIHVLRGTKSGSVILACGRSVFNRTGERSIGKVLAEFGGGGHHSAGTCQVPIVDCDAVLARLIEYFRGDRGAVSGVDGANLYTASDDAAVE